MSNDFLFVTCANGSEELLAEECIRILGPDQGVVAGRGGVMVDESVENAMRLNLRSRIAQRVLWPMVDGDYRDEHDLYDLGRRINWSEWITPDETIRVDVTAQRSPLQSLNFAALRIKDAVCDVMRDMAGARPSVDASVSFSGASPCCSRQPRLNKASPDRSIAIHACVGSTCRLIARSGKRVSTLGRAPAMSRMTSQTASLMRSAAKFRLCSGER